MTTRSEAGTVMEQGPEGISPGAEGASEDQPSSDEDNRLDDVLVDLLRRGFETRDAGSLKGWH